MYNIHSVKVSTRCPQRTVWTQCIQIIVSGLVAEIHSNLAQCNIKKTVNSAIEGECVPLEHFLPPIGASSHISNPDLECALDNETNSMTYRSKNHSRKITNHDTWSQAWVSYEKLMVAVFGNSIHESMADYRATILDYSKKYVWSSVCVYDFRHRSRMGTHTNLCFRQAKFHCCV